MMNKKIVTGALILGGGLSRRMGRAKALYPYQGSTFLERIVAAYEEADIAPILFVTHAGVAQDPDFPSLPNVERLVLEEPTASPLQTLWKGMDRIETCWDAFFMHPVDYPFVKSRTLRAMTRALQKEAALIVQPRCGDRGGHPVLLHMSLAREIRKASPAQGLREVVRRDRARVRGVMVEDPGVLQGVNCPADLIDLPPD